MTTLSVAIVNGKVWSRPGATAVAVAGERIAAVGTAEQVRGLRRRGTREVDAQGASILPAFNDAHVHFLMASRSLGELDLFGVETQAEIERRVVDYARAHDGGWVVGRGWFYSAFPGHMPTVELLDRLVPDRPAYLESFDAHTGWANSRALAIGGMPVGCAPACGSPLREGLHRSRKLVTDWTSFRCGSRCWRRAT